MYNQRRVFGGGVVPGLHTKGRKTQRGQGEKGRKRYEIKGRPLPFMSVLFLLHFCIYESCISSVAQAADCQVDLAPCINLMYYYYYYYDP